MPSGSTRNIVEENVYKNKTVFYLIKRKQLTVIVGPAIIRKMGLSKDNGGGGISKQFNTFDASII